MVAEQTPVHSSRSQTNQYGNFRNKKEIENLKSQ